MLQDLILTKNFIYNKKYSRIQSFFKLESWQYLKYHILDKHFIENFNTVIWFFYLFPNIPSYRILCIFSGNIEKNIYSLFFTKGICYLVEPKVYPSI